MNNSLKKEIIDILEQGIKDIDVLDKATQKIDSLRYDINLVIDLLKDSRND